MNIKLAIITVILLLSIKLIAQHSGVFRQKSPVFPYEISEINTDYLNASPYSRSYVGQEQKGSNSQVLNRYYTTGENRAYASYDVIQIDSFYYLSGRTRMYYNELPFAMKINMQGDTIWSRRDSLADADHWDCNTGQSLCQLSNGDLLQSFHIKIIDTEKSTHYPAFVSYDENSNTKFSYIWPDTTDFSLRGTIADDKGGFTFTGQLGSRTWKWVYFPTMGYGYWMPDSFYVGIVHVDSNLNIVAQNKIFVDDNNFFVVQDIIKAHNGGYIVGMQNLAPGGINGYSAANYFVYKFDSTLNLEWTIKMKDSVIRDGNPINIVASKFGGYIYSREHLTKGILYGKFDENGEILWEKSFKKTFDSLRPVFVIEDRPRGIIEKDNGDIIFGTKINEWDAAGLVRTDSLGNVKWARAIGTLRKEGHISNFWLYNVRNPIGEGALLVGRSGGLGAALIRTDSMGCTLPNCIDTVMYVGLEEIAELKTKTLIVYPNPTSDKIQIAINEQGTKLSQISIYDIQGRELFSEDISDFLFTHDVSDLSNGVYIVKVVSSKGEVFTEKFIKE